MLQTSSFIRNFKLFTDSCCLQSFAHNAADNYWDKILFCFCIPFFCFKCLLKLLIVEGVDFNSFKMKMKTVVESNFSFVVWSKLWEHFFCKLWEKEVWFNYSKNCKILELKLFELIHHLFQWLSKRFMMCSCIWSLKQIKQII